MFRNVVKNIIHQIPVSSIWSSSFFMSVHNAMHSADGKSVGNPSLSLNNPNQALVIGGIDDNWNHLRTTELISSSGSEERNRFPVRIAGHCSFTINATHSLVTGGWQNGSISANTWLVDLTTTTFTPGPIMKTARSFHGCSVFQRGTKSYGIVTGGMDIGRRYLDSTEMIKLDQESPTWTEGIQDKCKICILPLSKVFFLSIFRSKIIQRKTNKQTQKISTRIDLGRNPSRHLCHGWMVWRESQRSQKWGPSIGLPRRPKPNLPMEKSWKLAKF